MNFSVGQWLVIVVGDIMLRLLFTASFLVPLFALFALPISLLHLTLLTLCNYLVEPFELRARWSIAVTLLVTNVVFTVIFLFFWIGSIKSGQVTACSGDQCSWIRGEITAAGVRMILTTLAILVSINVLPVLMAVGLRSTAPGRAT